MLELLNDRLKGPAATWKCWIILRLHLKRWHSRKWRATFYLYPTLRRRPIQITLLRSSHRLAVDIKVDQVVKRRMMKTNIMRRPPKNDGFARQTANSCAPATTNHGPGTANSWSQPTHGQQEVTPEERQNARQNVQQRLSYPEIGTQLGHNWPHQQTSQQKVKGPDIEKPNESLVNFIHIGTSTTIESAPNVMTLMVAVMRLVLSNTKFMNMFHALNKSGGRVVLPVMFDDEERDNPALDVITENYQILTSLRTGRRYHVAS